MLNKILLDRYSEIAELAASVGIDWSQHCDQPFPFKTNAAQTKTIDKKHRGACGIIADVKVSKSGREYPFIYFKSFKEGGKEEKFSGYKYLSNNAQIKDAQTLEEARKKREAIKAQKEAEEAAKTLTAREKSVSEFLSMPICTESEYLNKKLLSQYSSLFRSSTDTHGKKVICHALYNENGDLVGYEKINDIGRGKYSSSGSGGGLRYSRHLINNDGTKTEGFIISEGKADSLVGSMLYELDAYSATSASMIKKTARHLMSKYGYSFCIVLADNDKTGEKSARFSVPEGEIIATKPKVLKDFSDVYIQYQGDIDAVRNEVFEGKFYQSSVRTENSRYFTLSPITDSINILLGEKGTGKTSLIMKLLDREEKAREARAQERKERGEKPMQEPRISILVITPRRVLTEKMGRELGCIYYEDVKEFNGAKGLSNLDRLAVSPEALKHVNAQNVYDYVIIDESEQTLPHLTHSSTFSGSNRQCYQVLRALCCNAKTVILADANAGECTNEFAQMIASHSDKAVNTLKNEYKPRAVRGDTFTIYKSKNAVFELARTDSAPFVFMSDSKNTCEDFARVCEEENKKALLLTANTVKHHASGLTRDPVAYVNQYDTVIYSPCFGTGFSVDKSEDGTSHKFTRAYAVFLGKSQTGEGCSQMLARFRNLGEYHASISDRLGKMLTSTEALTDLLIRKPMQFTKAQLELDISGAVVVDDFARAYIASEAARNSAFNDFKGSLINILREEGFTVISSSKRVKLNKKAELLMEAEKEARQEKETALTAEYAQELGAKFSLNNEFSLLVATADRKRKVFKKVQNINIARMHRQQAKRADAQEMQQAINGELSQIELTHYTARRQILNKVFKVLRVDMLTLKSEEAVFTSKSSELNTINKMKDAIYALFKVKLHSNKIKALGQLAALVGLGIKRKTAFSDDPNFVICPDSVKVMQAVLDIDSKQQIAA